MNNKKTVKLTIRNMDYYVVADGSESRAREIGDEVNRKINELMDSNSQISTTMAAVMLSLSYCEESKKEHEDAENLRSQVKDYLSENSRTRLELDDARREVERLRREVQVLRAKFAENR